MSELTVTLAMSGNAMMAPVNVEVLRYDLSVLERRWINGNQAQSFTLDPGIYSLRASLPSSRVFEKIVEIGTDESRNIQIPIHQASPHESHEWAYVARDITAAGNMRLSEDLYSGVWARLWSRAKGEAWQVDPLENPSELSDYDDGVSFSIETKINQQTMLQVGGDSIPWKLALLPPGKTTMILIRPATGPAGRVHPLELIVSSDDWQLESLLSLLSRGKTEDAQDLLEKKDLAAVAERRLQSKMQDPYGALIGGYALLKLHALDQMHNWAANLAKWFDWIPDGPVIHAWQLLELAKDQNDDAKRQEFIDNARHAFLQAAQRGIPVISDGLRQLRDGLLMFHRNDNNDEEIKLALARIGDYTSAADFTSTTTTFTGAHPDEPTTEPPVGCPVDGEFISYVYDVPLSDAVESGALTAGTQLSVVSDDANWTGQVTKQGEIEIPGGRTFKSVGAFQRAVVGSKKNVDYSWHLKGEMKAVREVAREGRFKPKRAYKR